MTKARTDAATRRIIAKAVSEHRAAPGETDGPSYGGGPLISLLTRHRSNSSVPPHLRLDYNATRRTVEDAKARKLDFNLLPSRKRKCMGEGAS